MTRLKEAVKWMEDIGLEPLLLLGHEDEVDDFEDAFIGVAKDSIAVYERDKVIKVFMDRDGMSYEEAIEWFDFNVQGAYVGEQTPLYIQTDFTD
tara:strand:+ start:3090 stop:3371 length:282 start_codon:yes stop_codon:yes gene_type:complete